LELSEAPLRVRPQFAPKLAKLKPQTAVVVVVAQTMALHDSHRLHLQHIQHFGLGLPALAMGWAKGEAAQMELQWLHASLAATDVMVALLARPTAH
jgi:hypothetical protein